MIRFLCSLGGLMVAATLAAPTAAVPQSLDLLITNARVVDGTGNPWFRADVGIRGGRIVEVGELSGRPATRVVDAGDRVVAPGFIDMMGVSSFPLVADPASAEGRLRQGVTTLLVGEGSSHAPQDERTLGEVTVRGRPVSWRTFDDYFRLLESRGIALNVVHNVGAAQVRRLVIGDEDRAPTAEQMVQMKALVRQAMEDGAVGLSTALIYPPGAYATTEELVELAKVAAEYGGAYFTHMRNESFDLLNSIREAIRIGEEAGLPAHIYHLKAAGRENWPLMERALEEISAARARGVDVTADVYPYTRNGIGLGSFLHPRHYARGADAFLATLSDPEVRRRLRQEVETTSDWENWYRHVGMDWDRVLIVEVGSGGDPAVVGLTVRGAAERMGKDVWDAFFDLVRQGGVGVTPESMDEEQKRAALRAPFVSIDADSPPVNPATERSAHPRAFGTFPRVLAKYVREDGVISLEEAVRKMTSLPANRLALHDRGRIAPGMVADLVVFDPARIQDRATYIQPLEYAEGVDYLVIDGRMVIDDGRLAVRNAGKVLRHRATPTPRASP